MQNKYLLISIPILFVVIGQISSKYGVIKLSETNQYFFYVFILIGYIALFLRGYIWIYILKKIEISKAYPMMSFSYVLIIPLSYFIFNEPITLNKITGASLIILGTILIGKNENYTRN